MTPDLLYQHFQKSGFDDMQADALAVIFGEMATKHDLELLRTELRSEMNILRSEMNSEMKAGMSTLRSEQTAALNAIRTEMATMKADLTWRFIALTVFLSTVVGLVGIYAG